MSDRTWQYEDILITVRAAPNPSKKYTETSCVAGVRLRDGSPIRIYPVPARQLPQANRFRKYSIIRARVTKASDPRHESYRVDFDSIKEIGNVDTGSRPSRSWQRRNKLVEPFRQANSIEALHTLQEELGVSEAPSLALVRPKAVKRFKIEKMDQTTWAPSQLARLQQLGMFDDAEKPTLEFVPYRFAYEFECDDSSCKGHDLRVLDWEVTESYRKWRPVYGESAWQEACKRSTGMI